MSAKRSGKSREFRLGNPSLILLLLSLALSASCLLSSCVSSRPPHSESPQSTYVPYEVRQRQLSQLQNWRLSGALSLMQTGSSAKLAHFSWLQRGLNRYRIQVSSPLDLYSLVILGQASGTVILQQGKDTRVASTPEALLQQTLGWSFPIRNLYYWVRGIPGGAASKQAYDPYGHLIQFSEQGWNIQLTQYNRLKTGVDVPGKLIMQRPGVQITLVLRSWTLF